MSSNVKNKNMYIHSLTDDFKKINEGKSKAVEIDLKKINIKQAVRLVKQNINDKKLAIELDNNKLYMLNDNTMNKLEKGLIDSNAVTGSTSYTDAYKVSHSDAAVETMIIKNNKIALKVIEPEPDKDKKKKITGKTRPAGAFFKHLNTTIFDFSRYGIFSEIVSDNYNDNCLYLAYKSRRYA